MVSSQEPRMTPDFFFGGSVPGVGVSQEESDRVRTYAGGLLTSNATDEQAMAGLRDASGRNLRALRAFAMRFERPRRSANDPLVRHVEDLVLAARDGTKVAPVTSDDRELIEQERQLLKLPLAEAFARLAKSLPDLGALAETLSDPAWIDAATTDTGLDPPDLKPLAATGVRGVYLRRRQRRFERDSRFGSLSAVDQGTKRLVTAVGHALRPVLRQMQESDDPLLRTQVAESVVAAHLRPPVGIPAPE